MELERPPEAPEPRDLGRVTPKEALKWFNRDKDAADLRAHADRNDAGALVIKAARTVSIEFRLEEPDGAYTACTCNDCWNEFFMGPFAEAVECPFCHGDAIHTENRLG